MTVPSIRGRLRWLNLAVVAAVLLVLGAASYMHTLDEVNELSDGRLAQSARTLQVLVDGGGDTGFAMPATPSGTPTRIDVEGHRFETEVGFQIYDAQGHRRMYTSNLGLLPAPAPATVGFGDVRFDSHDWRVFTLRSATGGPTIRVAERHDSRNEIMHGLMIEHALPLLFGLPLLAFLINWAVARGLRPLDELAWSLSRREPGNRGRVELANAPAELVPVVAAINGQLERLEDSLERERRFSADVAHELRTPLAATLVHLDNALAAVDDTVRTQRINAARKGGGQLARRIGQLLSLARLEAGAAGSAATDVDLVECVRETIEELSHVIDGSHVQLGVSSSDPSVVVQGHDAALKALVRNLVENSLRHVDDDGQVDVRISASPSWASIEVSDDGPGIPPARRAVVFTRFHRELAGAGDGYGLGLSIVKRAADLHGAAIELLDSSFGRGLRVRVEIPYRWKREP
ncbi:MAG TPA: ATP-binding protein [Pinirhizobacter sp.]|uniref:sensor histidine kinase n=1 Tax=Pinirhizobacter sp. TaxID=2950432 RepID=UPI002C248346|nr:ATP-binding protein [Pinirhizobacter sp.]HMH66806.1 ATP-binding protein [Pinirhizobacter sp.]